MDIKTESKTTIETIATFENGILKTHDCGLGEWWGNDICKEINFNEEIESVGIPKGNYKVKIVLEKIND
jgi:hypothetical protein